jgi:hypothetical protein
MCQGDELCFLGGSIGGGGGGTPWGYPCGWYYKTIQDRGVTDTLPRYLFKLIQRDRNRTLGVGEASADRMVMKANLVNLSIHPK